MYVQRNIQAH